jgi:hypothetical protein
MKAITLKQPWASLVASGLKQVENRTWAVPKSIRGERIAIHAGKGWDDYWNDYVDCRCWRRHHDGSPVETGFHCVRCQISEYTEGHDEAAKGVAGLILCTARVVGQLAPGKADWGVEWFTDEPCPCCNGYGQVEFWTGDPDMISDVEDCMECLTTGHARGSFDNQFRELQAFSWILADVELVSDPTNYRGKLGLWDVPGSLKEAA